MVLERTSGNHTTPISTEMQICNKGPHEPVQVEQDSLSSQVTTQSSESTPDIATGLRAAESPAAPRRKWTVLRQLKGILDLSHLPAPSDHDHIHQPLATAEPDTVWGEDESPDKGARDWPGPTPTFWHRVPSALAAACGWKPAVQSPRRRRRPLLLPTLRSPAACP
eukprot:CAMPEP_0172168822 /NCGR_PEP_ID=MMETSP1050-20130122/10362_1 /TAXON_ID=233186 /ORGANISM="Cryptomonas curvata, Strain CCAP979/52" /LENGTH=165 /DNA_ID=CAMNT_0012839809 /DNA_START=356 /DNA_END=850 /DNA_ORIENTATION=+